VLRLLVCLLYGVINVCEICHYCGVFFTIINVPKVGDGKLRVI